MLTSSTERWIRARLPLLVLAVLLCLGAANVASRATWREVEDGILWIEQNGSVVAAEIAPGTPAERVGLRRGDILLTIDSAPIVKVDDVIEALHRADRDTTLRYSVVHGLHDEATHQGEIHLLRKLYQRQGA